MRARGITYDTGGTVSRFPPVRAASHEIIADSATWLGNTLGAGSDHPFMAHVKESRYLKAVFCRVL